MDTSNVKLIRNISLIANTVLMLCVIGLLGVFYNYHVDYMVYHSIPTFVMYIIFYVLIFRGKIKAFFWLVYCTIAIYMGAATVCLGTNYGFNLYCMSLIPIAFFSEYLARRVGEYKSFTGLSSIGLVIIYFVSTGITVANGAVYEVEESASHVFFVLNSFFVFMFLIGYSALMISVIKDSEDKLAYMAHNDNLTGLFNRHYLMEQLRLMQETNSIYWIALADIDKFKSINDVYGHSSGDDVLKAVANAMNEVCEDCYIARWGGEEFLIVPKHENVDKGILEKLREYVEKLEITASEHNIKVSISIGAYDYSEELKLEKTIMKADENLYISKNNGRNRVTC